MAGKPAAVLAIAAPLLRPRTFVQRAVTLAICTGGIYVCFLSYAVLQERIYKKRYGKEQEEFQHASAPPIALQCTTVVANCGRELDELCCD